MFEEFLAARGVDEPYTDDDYFAYVDGKPRYDGVRSFLASRAITLPEGSPDDPPTAESVCGLGNRKNALVTELIERDGVEPYPGSVRFLDSLPASVKLAVVSSSRNAPRVLAVSGLAERFVTVVDGQVAASQHLKGKPAPDTFLAAASVLGVAPAEAVVYEDATSGVAAGRAGGFGLVVGVDRGAGERALRDNGADLVVRDLGELA